MNRGLLRADAERLTSEFWKWISILSLGVGTGIILTAYSPVFTLAGTLAFTVFTVGLYISSQYRRQTVSVSDNSALPVVAETQNTLLFYLFYLAFFLSITIPKSGRTIAKIPVTTANMLILLALIGWVAKFLFSPALMSRIPLFNTMMAFIFYGIVSGLIGFVNNNNLRAILLEFVAFVGFIPAYFLVCSTVRTTNQLHKLTKAIILSLVLVCVYGMLQLKIGFANVVIPGITEQYNIIMYPEFGGRWNLIEGGGKKLYSTFQNGNIFGSHLATFIPFIGGIMIGVRSFRKKLIISGIGILVCCTLFLTYSRGALIGAISGVLVLAVLSNKIRLKVFVGVFIAFILVFSAFLYQYSKRPELNRYDFRKITVNPNQFSAGRLERAQQVLSGFQHLSLIEKLFGIGLGGVLTSPPYWRLEYIDNLYLTLLFKMGLVGLSLLFWMLGRLFLTLLAWRSKTSDLRIQALINGGIAGLASSLVHNLADLLWFFPPLSVNFWFLAGITMCIGMIRAQHPELQVMTHDNAKNA